MAAAVSGAIEGFLSAVEEHDLTEETKRGLHEAGAIARETSGEMRRQADTPEMRELKHDIARAGQAAANKTRNVAGAAASTASHAKDIVGEKAHGAKETMAHAKDVVKEKASHAADEVRVRKDAVVETSRRAKHAPGVITSEMKGAASAWWGAIVTSIAMGAAMAVFGIVTLVVLTIALVVWMNILVGDPWGTFLVAGIYALLIGIAWGVSKSASARSKKEIREHVQNSREEIDHVVRPVRSAFTGRGKTGF